MDKKLMKIIGIVMFAVGLLMFFKNIKVTSFSFGRSGVGVIMLLIGIDFILMFVKQNKIFYLIFVVLIIALIISVILNMRIFLLGMSLFKWIFITILIFGGLGLTVKSTIKD